jgi:WD40 repeat protein
MTWQYVNEVAVAEFTGLGGAKFCRVTLHMAGSTPAAVRGGPPFKGYVPRFRSYGFAWSLGNIHAPIGLVTSAFRDAVPPGVTVTASFDSNDVRHLYRGPQRTGMALWTVGLVIVLAATYVFATPPNPMALKGSQWNKLLEFGPDGTLASDTTDGRIKLWNVVKHTNTATLPGHEEGVKALRFSPDAKTLASAGRSDHTIKLWNLSSDAVSMTLTVGDHGSAKSLAFDAFGRTLASLDEDNTITLWDVHTGKNIGTITQNTDKVETIDFESDLELDGLDSGHMPRSWNLLNGRSRTPSRTHPWAYIGGGGGGNTVDLVAGDTGKPIRTLSGHTEEVNDVDWAERESQLLATSSLDMTIRIWDTDTGETVRTLKLGDRQIVAFGSDEKVWLWRTGIHS